MRAKYYLVARGVEFVAIDITKDRGAEAELVALGVFRMPVIRRGKHHASGFVPAEIDALLGISADPSSRALSGTEIVERSTLLLEAVQRYARQVPPEHYEDDFPSLAGVEPPIVMEGEVLIHPVDGLPYVPHRSFIGLVRHIVKHGLHLIRAIEEPDPDLDSMTHMQYESWGEPARETGIDDLIPVMDQTVARIRQWWDETGGVDLGHVTSTYVGQRTTREILQRNTYALVQHTRQLMGLLRSLGIEPDGPIGDELAEGLNVPAGIFS
jgi:hypothetical protein